MSRPLRHLRWGEPRRSPRAKFARVPRPVGGGSAVLRGRCLEAMAYAVEQVADRATVFVCTGLPRVRVLLRWEVAHGR